jgi:hypothetical protein
VWPIPDSTFPCDLDLGSGKAAPPTVVREHIAKQWIDGGVNLPNGNLVGIGSGMAAAGVKPDALLVSQNGKYLYVANLGSSTVSSTR